MEYYEKISTGIIGPEILLRNDSSFFEERR